MANGSSGITQKEKDYFSTYFPSFAPGGSPAASTVPADPQLFSGPRFSPYFGPTGAQYDALSPADRTYHRITDQYNLQRLFTDQAFAQARSGLQEQLETVRSGFGEATAALDRQGGAARRRALEREQQISAEMQARTGGRSYAYDYMRRGLAADTTRALADIEESLGSLYSGLALQRTGMELGVLGNISTSYLQQAETYQDLLAQQFSLLGGYQPQGARDRDYSGLYNLGGSLVNAAGYYFGQKAGQDPGGGDG